MLQIGKTNKVKTITSNYSCNGFEDVILVNASGGNILITLSSPINSGKIVTIKKIDSSNNLVTNL